MQARAKYDFVAAEPDELSFTHGTIIKIISMEDDANWFKAELRGDVGYVPRTYIDMLPFPWFYGKISRLESERLLLTERPDGKPMQPEGAFLVRYSESSPGDLSISVKSQNTVQHYKILRGAGKYYLWVVKFDSVNELIEYHRKSSISRTNHLPLIDMVDVNRSRSAMVSMTPLHQINSAGSAFGGQNSMVSAASSTAPTGMDCNMMSQQEHQQHQQLKLRGQVNSGKRYAEPGCTNVQRSSQQFQTHSAPTRPTHTGAGNSGLPQFVQAAYDFDPQDASEVVIRQGDVIRVIEKYDDNWLKGEVNGKVGLVPISYVCPYQ